MADDEASYAQAVRFLASLRSQKNQDAEAQRAFLHAKGLSEDVIARAFADVKRPASIGDEVAQRAADAPDVGDGSDSVDDSSAFERASRMFDEPLGAEAEQATPTAPPKTYPRSPLALYHHQLEQRQGDAHSHGEANPTTRYEVILAFLRSMSFFLVLGGGVTGVLVALYRAYMLPRLITTLDCRSLLLKHHLDQFNILTNRIKGLRGNSLAPTSQRANPATTRKGVLKKVQFADEIVKEKVRIVEEEEKKEAGEKEHGSEGRMGDNKGAVDELQNESDESKEEGREGESRDKEALETIDILEPVRNSLARLSRCLEADWSAAAIGTAIAPSTPTTHTQRELTASTATTVEEESDADSWVSDEDSDELEFDPYSPKTPSTHKKKHDPASAAKEPSPMPLTSDTNATSLQSSLSTFNAYVNSQTYMAGAHVYGGLRTLSAAGADKESKAGDVAQIRADIRNLKGLLLSR